ncbi:MAG: polysaccharide deacetylase [Lachnospiraceae bacterium]|nr:polysaccharide deacetylase [Lachnospiraceae bacterium]
MPEERQNTRRTRVNRLKKMILYVTFLLLFSSILCTAVLFLQVRNLNRRLDDVTRQFDSIREEKSRSDSPPKGNAPEKTRSKEQAESAGTEDTGAQEKRKCKVYLTFDDGPSPNTGKILDVLAEYDVKATFFVTGKEGEYYDQLYRRIVDEGHTLGMHSYSHKYHEIYASSRAFEQDLEKLQDLLYVKTGVWSRFYRFPGGSSNHVSSVPMQELADYLEKQDIYYLDWNIVSGDASGVPQSAKALSDRVLSLIGKEETEVVLMHDAADKDSTVEALSIILQQITRRDDVEVLPVTEDMDFESVHHLSNEGEQ